MAKLMQVNNQLLVRPLLDFSRQEIEAYAHKHQLRWVEDESNQDVDFDRNFLRHKIIPLLKDRWPSVNKTFARSAQHCADSQILLDEMAEEDLQHCRLSKASLSVSALLAFSTARFNNVLRFFMQQHQLKMPSYAQLKEINQQIQADNDKSPTIQLENHCFRRFKNALFLTEIYQDVSTWRSGITFSHDNTEALTLPDSLGKLNLSIVPVENDRESQPSQAKFLASLLAIPPKEDEEITVRFDHNNPICLPSYRQHSRSLKKIFQELAIPPWQRKRLPLIYYNNTLIAVMGYFVCKEYQVENNLALNQQPLCFTWNKE